jgi:DNA-binding transcriptional regulator YhcF (GntR family)
VGLEWGVQSYTYKFLRLILLREAAMHFWFVHSGDVSIREQIVTQITLGILSEELTSGERLPSTRDLARRFHLHANTVSAAYHQLELEGWVESRRGSGVFVRDQRPALRNVPGSSSQALDHIFTRFLNSARKLEIPLSEVKELVHKWLDAPVKTGFLLIEPREELREIALAEIRQALAISVSGCSPDDPMLMEKLVGVIPLVFPSKAATVRSLLPSGTELIILQIRSAASSLAERLPAPSDALIGVASAWPTFLETARTMLVAAGFAADALLLRDASVKGWQDGLEQTAGVVCDVFTATRLPKTIRTATFPVVSEVAIEELKRRAGAIAPPHS